jgi:predicted metal-dependent phosphoesterase TrpH
VTSVDDLAEHVARAGIDVVCITDHNVTAAAVAAAERGIGARVIVGEEIRTREGDLIGLFLTERVPYVLPMTEAAGLIRAQGGLVYLPHPFDPGRSSLGAGAQALCEAGLADVVEVFNAKISDQSRNDEAARLAARFGLPGAAGSDAHDPEGIGAAYLRMPDFDGPEQFLAGLAQATITGEYRPHAPRYARRPV